MTLFNLSALLITFTFIIITCCKIQDQSKMELLTALCALGALLVAVWALLPSDPARRRRERAIDQVPGPRRWPLIGTAYLVFGVKRTELWNTFSDIINHYRPIFRTWNGPVPDVHISEADYIETILKSSVNITKGYVYEFLHPWLGTGLLTSTGQKWHSHRKLITPTFHFKILENFLEVFTEKSEILVKKLEKEIGNSKGFDVYPYITHCALDIICETAMGTEINAQDDSHSDYVAAIYDMSELIVNRLIKPWVHSDFIYSFTKNGKRYKECLNILHSFTKKVIEERKQSRKQTPKKQEEAEQNVLGKKRRMAFLDLLLEAAEGGAALSDEDIREEVDTFMFEGHDTTSAGMCWVLLLLGNHPEIQERVFEEQEAIFQGSDRLPNMEDLNDMKYLERVIKETLRLYPSVPIILRTLSEDVQFGEYNIPAGTHVNVHIFHAHRNPKYFPNPDVFDPDNFLPERVQGRHPYAYVPFSAGSRNCIGQRFALLEEKVLLSAVVRRFRVRALQRPEQVAVVGELVLRPAHGVRLTLERRP